MAHVMICRCHDPAERGAHIPGGPSEWELAADVCEAIRNHLWFTPHAAVRLERTLEARINTINALCNKWKVPIYAVEVHFNACDDSTRQGYSVMAYHTSREGRGIAEYILSELQRVRRHATNKGINLVDKHRQWIGTGHECEASRQGFVSDTICPAVLVEALFLTHPGERAWVQNPSNRALLGQAIGRGFEKFLNGTR